MNILTKGQPGEARIEVVDRFEHPKHGPCVTVRVSGRDVANTTSPDTVAGWVRTVAALRACGWAPA